MAAEQQAAAVGRESRDRLLCLEHLSEGVLLLEERGEVCWANPAAHGMFRAEPIAEGETRTVTAFTGLSSLQAWVDRNPRSERMRHSFEVERDTGEIQSLEMTLIPAGDGQRLAILQDLQLGALVDKRRRDFVANASHELKTPIAAILGMLDLLDQVEESQRADLLERARRNAQGLGNLVDDMLQLSRADDPDWRPAPSPLDLDALIGEVLEDLQDAAREKGLRLDYLPEAPGLDLLADRFSLKTVVQNLVLNAVVYTREGKVDVTTRNPQPGVLRISVRDTGPGIDPETLPRIFERFFRGDVAHSRASGGTGLGLAIVRNLLRRMGGRISVRSEPGVGSEFVVELPTNPTRPLASS